MVMKYDFSGIRKHSEGRIASKLLVGCGNSVKINGETVWEDYDGFASAESKKPITADSIYRLCSMSKPITGVAVMQLVEQRKIDLFDSIAKFVPTLTGFGVGAFGENGEFVKVADAERDITVFDLLTHTSGLAQADFGFQMSDKVIMREYFKQGAKLADVVPHFNKVLLDSQPGAAMGYGAILAYDLLGYIVEVVSGMPYGEYLKKNLTGPLGMVDTTFHPTAEQMDRVVDLYEANGETWKLEPRSTTESMYGIPQSYEAGSAGLFGTLRDYQTFAEMLLNFGTYKGVKILDANLVRLMSTPLNRPDTVGYNIGQVWGLSMRVINNPDPNMVPPAGTFGWSGAYGTHFIVCPRCNLSAVYCTNLTNAGGSGAYTAFEFEQDIFGALKKAEG